MQKVSNIILLLVSLLPVCAGCGEGDGTVPVSGVVTLDGQPLPGAIVTFSRPDLPPSQNTGWVGRTDAEGRYTINPMMGGGSGAPPAKYQVSLTTAVTDPSQPAPANSRSSSPFPPESPPPAPEKIPPKSRVQEFEVPADGTDAANFDIKSK